MRMSLDRVRLGTTSGLLLLAATVLLADPTRFSDFTPLASSAGPTADESAPITFGNPDFEQQSIADRVAQLASGSPNTGSWDMNTLNETGPHKGRYLFTVFETGQPGVQRHDLLTGQTDTLWQALAAGTHTSFDPSYSTGAFTWVPFTDANGAALPGALTITDPSGVTSVDARNTTNLPQFKGTDYMRPEDIQIQTLHGSDYLYVTTTTTHEVYRIDLKKQTIAVFADRNTIDLATGAAVGNALANPDNLAIDHDGNIYIVEARNGGVDDDIWFARDRNMDGDLKDPGEGIGRWASNGTVGSEFTGLYFDPRNKRRAWVNIQHPSSGNDRTIEITIPKGHDDDDTDEDDDE